MNFKKEISKGIPNVLPPKKEYDFSVNHAPNRENILSNNEKKLALKSALSVKLNEDKILIIDSFEIKSFKTKELISDLKQFDCNSALFIYSSDGLNKNFKLASSNIPKVSTLSQKGVNVKDLITYDKIFIEQKSILEITKRLS